MQLIDVDALREAIEEIEWYSLYNGHIINGAKREEEAFYKVVDVFAATYNVPAIEAAPIKHGRWERYYYSYFGQHQCVCSECKDSEYWKRYYCYGVESYCPNCGAKMDLEVK